MSGMTLATERPQGIEHVGNEDHPSHGALSRSRSPALRCIFKTEGITTIRTLDKLALYTLAVVTVIDLARYRQRERSRLGRREALLTWEEEGGSLPLPH